MKRKLIKLILLLAFIVVLINLITFSVEVVSVRKNNYAVNSNTTYDETIEALQEVAYSYYMRGTQIQYNSMKRSASTFSPEDATSQNKNYMVCSGFCESVYKELMDIAIPRTTDRLIQYAPDHVGNKEVIGYGTKDTDKNLIMNIYDNGTLNVSLTNPTISQIIPYLKSGDVLTYSGHTMLVYDLVYDTNGQVIDAIMLHSQAENGYTESKISKKVTYKKPISNGATTSETGSFGTPTHFLYYARVKNNKFGQTCTEGTINMIKISDEKSWKAMGNDRDYSILRFITKDSNGNARLNYMGEDYYDSNHENELIQLPDRTLDRLKYRNLFIEKTVDAFNDSVVEPNDVLTYSITIKNKSEENYTDNLNIIENFSPYVTYQNYKVYQNNNEISVQSNLDQSSISWNIGKLNSGDEYRIEYSVRVNSNTYGNVITSTGKVGNISSGSVKNVVGNNLTNAQKNQIIQAYKNYAGGNNGKEFINDIYSSIGKDINLNDLNLNQLITNNNPESDAASTISINSSNKFSSIVLNNYWSCLKKAQYTTLAGDIYHYDLKNWRKYTDSKRRADTVFDEHLQTGDILVYINNDDNKYNYTKEQIIKTPVTYENGEYAYIFIEGYTKDENGEDVSGFVGINLGSDNVANTNDDRNEFNKEYYSNNGLNLYGNGSTTDRYLLDYLNYQSVFGKDYYVILRPSLGFDVTPPELTVSYSTTEITNQSVTATITSNEQVQSVSGWTLSSDKKTLTKSYTANATESVTVKDLAGNEKTAQITISNIDKTAPTLSVAYSTTEITNQNVTATITSNEQVQSVSGWTLSSDKKTLTKSYSANATESVTVKDLAGNSKTAQITISNIDKTAPTLSVAYSTTEITNQSVTATITSNEQVQSVSGWTLSSDKKTLTKSYTANTTESVTVKDLAGNEKTVTIKIENISTTKLGDLNENDQIDLGDLILIHRHISATNKESVANRHSDWKLSDEKISIADFNKNGRLDIGDGLRIQRYIAASNDEEVAAQHPDWLVLN